MFLAGLVWTEQLLGGRTPGSKIYYASDTKREQNMERERERVRITVTVNLTQTWLCSGLSHTFFAK